MVIQYNITVTIINLTDNSTENYNKTFSSEITAENDSLLYNNHHTIVKSANILNMFDEEISAYCSAHEIQKESVDIDEFEIVSLTDRVDVYFESYGDNSIQLSPVIMAYVYPKNDALRVPVLTGTAYDENTIIWAWPEDEAYAHYLIETPEEQSFEPYTIIATIPIGVTSYAETGLEPDTTYSRRLINFTGEQTSSPSEAVTIQTKPISAKIESEEYNTARNYDFTSVNSERENDTENYDAFHSGIGHGNDLKVYKQMDAGVPQRFKPLFKISGRRIQREKRYDQVGFKYKLCLEAMEEIDEQEGEVTFDVNVYGRSSVSLQEYAWVTKPVKVYSKLTCDVFLRKTVSGQSTTKVSTYHPTYKHEKEEHDVHIPGTPGTDGYWDPKPWDEPTETWVDLPDNVSEWYEVTPAKYKIIPPSVNAGNMKILFVIDCTASLRDYMVGRFVDMKVGYKNETSKEMYWTRKDDASSLWKTWENSGDERADKIKCVFGYYNVSANDGTGDTVHDNLVSGHNYGAIRYMRQMICSAIDKAEGAVNSALSGASVGSIAAYSALVGIINAQMPGHIKDPDDPDDGGYYTEDEWTHVLANASANIEPGTSLVSIETEDESASTSTTVNVKFGIVLFGNGYYDLSKGWKTASEAKALIGGESDTGSSTFVGIAGTDASPGGTSTFTKATDWIAGLKGARQFLKDHVPNETDTKVMCFVTDGFPNTIDGSQLYKKDSNDKKIEYHMAGKQHKWNNNNWFGDDTEENPYHSGDKGKGDTSFIGEITATTVDDDTLLPKLKKAITKTKKVFNHCMLFSCAFDKFLFDVDGGDKMAFEGKRLTYGYLKSFIDKINGFNTTYDDYCIATKGKTGTNLAFKWDDTDLDMAFINAIPLIIGDYSWKLISPLKAEHKTRTVDGGKKKITGSIHHEGTWHEGTPGTDPVDYKQYDGEKLSFDSWVKDPEESIVVEYNIDDYKVVRIEHVFDPFEITSELTNTVYSDKEKRAVIPIECIMTKRPLTEQSIWDIIWPKVQMTPEYQDGYTQTIGTVESSSAEEDTFLVAGLHIQDSFVLNDGTVYDPANDLIYEDGWNGSINVFTDIDKMGTETQYGDDCYIVKKKSYANGGNPVYIQGYTDAIIFDCTRFYDTELNAFDNSERVIITAEDNSSFQLMRNRMNKDLTIQRSETTDTIRRIVSVLDCEEGIKVKSGDTITGEYITQHGSCELPATFGSISVEMKANGDNTEYIKYTSPVLNYRFNLEDPDAMTPLYEILPKCHRTDKRKFIVILHIYYAKNVYITNRNHYVQEFGESPLANSSSPFLYSVDGTNYQSGGDESLMEEGFVKWSIKEPETGINDNTWYLDQYLWFSAKPMKKVQKYYDELPKEGMEPFYGLVNGRYSASNPNGMRDLRQQVSSFNIPTTVLDKYADTVKIYIMIAEYVPSSAIVSYRWDNPYNHIDSITQTNGDFVTFHSDSVSYKDEEYIDSIATIDMPSDIINGGESKEVTYTINKPSSAREYVEYYLDLSVDNSDVLPMKYPSVIGFDDNESTEVAVDYKNVINSTSKWSPRIHNGYYYLNQHEYYAYSEFNVEADFETSTTRSYREIEGNILIEVDLRRPASAPEYYTVTKSTRAELLQDERNFTWVDGKGLTVATTLDGKYYKEFYMGEYMSPPIVFPSVLTSTDKLKVEMSYGDNNNYTVPMSIRYYSLAEGAWSEWSPFENDTAPEVPAYAYQVKLSLQAGVSQTETSVDDYLCCHLDWKDDGSDDTVNISTITDYMTSGEDKGTGTYVSKIFDNGCVSKMSFELFESAYTNACKLYIAVDDKKADNLDISYVSWIDISNRKGSYITGRYYRYKIEIPFGEKVYWLRKQIVTNNTTAIMPYIKSITMTGMYAPSDTVDSFTNTESFTLTTDTHEYIVIPNVFNVISSDVIAKGFNYDEIERVFIRSLSSNITISYPDEINSDHPFRYLSASVKARTVSEEFDVKTVDTPYIFPIRDNIGNQLMIIHGTPQQYSPITVEDMYGNPYVQLFDGSDISLERNPISGGTFSFMKIEEEISLKESTKFYELRRNDYELSTLKVYVNDELIDTSLYNTVNHLVIFKNMLKEGDLLHINYMVSRSFVAVIDRKKDTTTIYTYSGRNSHGLNVINDQRVKYKVFFETNKETNKFIADKLSLNPVYRTDYDGFIYLTDEHNEPETIRIFCDPLRLKAGGYDKTDISIEVVDIHNNPVINKRVEIDCVYGILTIDSSKTDMNGIIHLVYESSYIPATDTLTARTLKDDDTVVSASIEIISE